MPTLIDNMTFFYHLNTNEYTGNPSGHVAILVVKDNGNVVDASPVECKLEAIREHCQAIYDNIGDVKLPANEHGSLFDYEFIHAEMQKELDAANERIAAEQLHFELEHKRKLAKEFLDILSMQSFDDFYNGAHKDHIEGEENALTEEELIALVIKKFL